MTTKPLDLARHNQALAAIHALSHNISTQQDMDRLLHQIITKAAELLDAEQGGGIFLYEPEANLLRMVDAIGKVEELIGMTLRPGEGLAGRVLESGKVMSVDDYGSWTDRVGEFEGYGLTALLCAPLKWHDEVLGVLTLHSNVERRTFERADRWLVELFAAQAAIALGNARLFRASERRAAEYGALQKIALELLAAGDLQHTLGVIAREVLDHSGAKNVHIYLYDHTQDKLTFGASLNHEGIVDHEVFQPRPNGLTATVARTGEARHVDNPYQHPLFASMMDRPDWNFETILSFPLKRDETVIGVFNLVFDHQISLELWSFLELVATQAAVAVANARTTAALNDIAAVLNSTLHLDEVLERILGNIGKVVPFDAASIMRVDGDYAQVAGVQGFTGSTDIEAVLKIRVPIATTNLQTISETGEPNIVPDTRNDEIWMVVPETRWIRSNLTAPISVGGEVMGFISLDSRMPGFFTQDHAKRLKAFTDQASVAMQNARLYENTQRRADEFTALSTVAVSLLSSTDMKQTLQVIASETVQQAQAQDVHIYLYDADRDQLTFGTSLWALTGEFDRLVTPPRPEGSTYRVARSGERLVVQNPDEHPMFQHVLEQWDWPFLSMVALPLTVGGRVTGVFNIFFDHPVTADRLHFLELLASQAAVAINNARLYEAEREARARADALRNATEVLSSTLSLDDALDAIMAQCKEVLEFKTGSLLVYEQGNPVMMAVEGYEDEAPLLTEETREGLRDAAPLQAIIKSGKPLIIPNTREYEGWVIFAHGQHILSWLGVPLIARGALVGVLMLDSDRVGAYGERDLEIAEALARQAAVAISNARLYEAERDARNKADILLEATEALAATLSLEEILHEIIQQCRGVIDYATSSVLVYRDGKPHMAALSGYEGHEPVIVAQTKDGLRESKILARMRESRESLIIPDVREHADWITLPEGGHIRGWLGVPLVVRDEMQGVLMFDSTEINAYTDEDREFAEAIATQAAVALQNAYLFEETQRAQERFRDIAVNTSDWLWEVDMDGVLIYSSRTMVDALGLPSDELLGRNIYDFLSQEDRDRVMSLAQRGLRRRDFVLRFEAGFKHVDGHDVLLSVTGTPVFDADGKMAGYRGAVTDITREREAEQREQLAFELGQQLVSVLAFDELMQVIVQRIQQTFDYYHVILFMFNGETQVLEAKAEVTQEKPGPGFAGMANIPLDARPSLNAEAGRSLSVVVSNDVLNDPRFLYHPGLSRVRSEVACALYRGDHLLGVLDVKSTQVHHFEDAEIRSLTNLAAQISVALENARLYRELEQQTEHLEVLVRERTSEINRERERLTAIVESAGEGIIFTRGDGAVEYANPAWEVLSGYTVAQAGGKPIQEILQSREGDEDHLRRAINAGSDWAGELVARRPDGSEYVAGLTIAPVRDDAGEVTYLVGVMRDLTAEKEVERMRRKFVANVSHELRTPITNIKLYHTLLAGGAIDRQPEYLDTMQGEISRLERLVEDLLDLSRLDRGVVGLKVEPLEMNTLVQEVLRAHHLRAEERGLSINTDLADSLPTLQGDRERLKQVLVNLLMNAINYTTDGDEIGVRTWLDLENDQPRVAVSVWDTGVGIDPEDLPFVFNRFFRAETAKTTGIPGTGLGLAIVREIIDLHRGQIKAESMPERGTQFVAYLPLGGFDDTVDRERGLD